MAVNSEVRVDYSAVQMDRLARGGEIETDDQSDAFAIKLVAS